MRKGDMKKKKKKVKKTVAKNAKLGRQIKRRLRGIKVPLVSPPRRPRASRVEFVNGRTGQATPVAPPQAAESSVSAPAPPAPTPPPAPPQGVPEEGASELSAEELSAAEDAYDLEAARLAMAEPEPHVSFNDLKAKLGADREFQRRQVRGSWNTPNPHRYTRPFGG